MFWSLTTIVTAWTPPLNQLITILVFESHFKSSSNILSSAKILKKEDVKKFLPFSPQPEEGSYVLRLVK